MLESHQLLEGHTDRVWTLAWSPCGEILASSGADKTIRLWTKDSSGSWKCITILSDAHTKSIRRICWSPCGSYLASAGFDSIVCIWKRNPSDKSWSSLVNLEGHESEIKSVAWSHDGNYLSTCGRDRTIWIWERVSGAMDCDELSDSAENWDCSDIKEDHNKDVKHIRWHPDHNILASCSYDDTVKFFSKVGDSWECCETLSSHDSTVWSIDFSRTGRYLVTAGEDRTVRVWMNNSHDKLPLIESNSWKCLSVIQGYHNRSIYDVSWCKLDDVIATASGDNSIAIYSRIPGQDGNDTFICCEKVSQAHTCDVNSVAWNPKRKSLLASSGDDRLIKLWQFIQDDRGMEPLTVLDQSIRNLSEFSHESNKELFISQLSGQSSPNVSIDSHADLAKLVDLAQQIQTELSFDNELRVLEQSTGYVLRNDTQQHIQITEICFQQAGTVERFSVNILDMRGQIRYKFKVIFNGEFAILLPKRSDKLVAILGEIFVIEKSGDLYKMIHSGECHFILGHLFVLADVQFILDEGGKGILYVISADRDEKIRISNYPDTFDIERYCFGHKKLIRRLIVSKSDNKLISVDKSDEVCVWDLNKLNNPKTPNEPLKPEQTFLLAEKEKKRLCAA